jgi:hypothetical protein
MKVHDHVYQQGLPEVRRLAYDCRESVTPRSERPAGYRVVRALQLSIQVEDCGWKKTAS